MPNIILRQDLGNTEPRSANVVVKSSGLSNIELDNNFNNINNNVEYNTKNIDVLFNQVFSAYSQSNSAFLAANNVASQIESTFNQANTGVVQAQSALESANTKFSSSGGNISGPVEISSNLLVTGNLTVSGNVTTVSANNLVLQDNMIYLNDGSIISNPDLGLTGNYNDDKYRHAGFFRDASDGIWKIFDQYEPEPDASPYIDTSNSTFRITDFQANNIYANTFSGIANNSNYLNGKSDNYFIVYTNNTISSNVNILQNINLTQNSSITSAFNQANTGVVQAQAAFAKANTEISINGVGVSLGGSVTVNASIPTSENLQINSLGVGTTASGTTGSLRATGSITAYYSDKRLKENIIPIKEPIQKLKNITGYYYNSNDKAFNLGYTDKGKQIGLLAQEVQKEVPEAVKLAPIDSLFDENGKEYSKTGENYLTIQYEKLIPLLVEAIKEQQIKIEQQEQKIQKLTTVIENFD